MYILQQENYHLQNCDQLLTDMLQEANASNQSLHADRPSAYDYVCRPTAHHYVSIMAIKVMAEDRSVTNRK